jgi:moderate conductance mechanosensitive channel
MKPVFTPKAAGAATFATVAIKIGLIVLGAIILIRLASILVNRLERTVRRKGDEEASREKRARTLGGVVRGLTRITVAVVAVMMGVRELGLDITPALAAAGGFGVAAGLGAQSVVRDWIVGFFIIYDNEYVVGDVVQVAGVAGTVEILTLRHTEVRDGEGALHYVPNGEIKVVSNLTKSWSTPVVRIPVSLTEDPAKVTAALERYLAEAAEDPALKPLLRDRPQVLGMEDVSVGQYTMMIQAKTHPEHRLLVARALRAGAVSRLRVEGIAIHGPMPDMARPAPGAAGRERDAGLHHAGGGA